MRMVRDACKAYGYEVSPKIEDEFRLHRTHNDAVFSAYTPEIRAARHCGLITACRTPTAADASSVITAASPSMAWTA